MMIRAKEARRLLQSASDNQLSADEEQAISAEIRAAARKGLREISLYPPSFDASDGDSLGKMRSRWSRAARAALVGHGFDAEIRHSGSGRSVWCKW